MACVRGSAPGSVCFAHVTKTVHGSPVGDRCNRVRSFDEEDETTGFGGLPRDGIPVHFEGRLFRAKRYDGRICHGLLVGGLLTAHGGPIGWLASGDPVIGVG